VFELLPPVQAGGAWTEMVLYSFTGMADGGIPLAGLAMDRAGNLYGTTSEGGVAACNCGVVFKLARSSGGGWLESVLHTFTGGPESLLPKPASCYTTAPYMARRSKAAAPSRA